MSPAEDAPRGDAATPGAGADPPVDLVALALLQGIAQTGSLGAAARRLNLAQPNATRLLRRLERDLRLPLVLRSPRGSTLTEQGRLVVDWAAPVLAAADHLVAGVQSLRHDAATQLSIGASLTVGEHLAPAWLGAFRQHHPRVRVRLRVANSADVVRDVAAERLDLGFIETPGAPAHLASAVVAHDDLVLVTHPGHPWARRRAPVPRAEVAATPLVAREPGSGTRETVQAAFASFETAPPLMELSSTQAITRSVAAGAGPALVSRLAVQDALRSGLLRAIPVQGPPIGRDLRAVWPRGRRPSGLAADFVAHVAAT